MAAHQKRPDWPMAEAHAESALQLAETLHLRPDLAVGRQDYARLLAEKGDLDAAREQLDQAEALFREIGMDWWTEQAEGLRGRIDRGESFKWFAPYVDGPTAG